MDAQKLSTALHAMLAEMVPVACSPNRAGEIAVLIDAAFPPATPPATTGLKWGASVVKARDGDWNVQTDSHWLSATPSWEGRYNGDQRTGVFPTEAEALSALASAPPPPGSSPQEGDRSEYWRKQAVDAESALDDLLGVARKVHAHFNPPKPEDDEAIDELRAAISRAESFPEGAAVTNPSPATAEDEDILAALRDRRTIYRVTDGHSFNTDARDQLERLHAAALSEIERLRNARRRTTARYRMCCSKCSASVPVVAMLVSGEGPRSVLCNGEGEWIMADPSRTIPADVRRHDGES